MPRTADLVVDRKWHFPLGIDEQRNFDDWVSSSVARNPVIVADNVAAYIDERGTSDLTNLPSLAPPWASFWIEYPSTSGRQRRGVWVVDSTDAPELDEHFRLLADTATRQPLRSGDRRWTVTFVLFTETDRRKVWGPLGMSSLTLDEHGAVLGHAWSVAPMLEIGQTARAILDDRPDVDLSEPPSPLTVAEIKALNDEQARGLYEQAEAREAELIAQLETLDNRRRELEEVGNAIYGAVAVTGGNDPDDAWLTRALAPAYQAVAFLHCKNVALDEVVPAPKVQAKRRRSGKEPLVRYHTLRLDVPRRGGGGTTEGSDSSAKSLHIVAGHFAHYGACCPTHPPHGRLFGRLEGIYWVPTHARGNKQVGTVRTDFDLRIPA